MSRRILLLLLVFLTVGGVAGATPAPAPADPSHPAALGVILLDISPELRAHFGAPEDRGVLVDRVRPDSAAAKAGVHVGDVIVQIGADHASSVRAARRVLRDHHEGDRVDVVVLRDGKPLTLSATLDASAAPVPQLDDDSMFELDPEHADEQLQRMMERAREMFRQFQQHQPPANGGTDRV